MVVIHLKMTGGGGDKRGGGACAADDGFLYETTTKTTNETLISNLVAMHNVRLRVALIVDAVAGTGGLADCGPAKQQPAEAAAATITRATDDSARTGNPPEKGLADIMRKEARALEQSVGKNQVKNKTALTVGAVEERIRNVRGAVTMAYPEGLPEGDSARVALDDDWDMLKGTYIGPSLLDPRTAALWSAGKEFPRSGLVSDRLGSTNEKTKIVCKLTSTRDSGPPARELAVSEEERNAMMAHHFKRQEELKRLAEAENNGDGDEYLGSAWADPRGMKRDLQGLGDVKAPGMMF